MVTPFEPDVGVAVHPLPIRLPRAVGGKARDPVCLTLGGDRRNSVPGGRGQHDVNASANQTASDLSRPVAIRLAVRNHEADRVFLTISADDAVPDRFSPTLHAIFVRNSE